jgi:UDP-N-acetylglucosamine diphosphorylase / glucose-1-phosphate thymidylyltransferase / UDP-N-acetylgalactosamine diphosphorylase / glucosamine-1-phosphate N-acetyltransferase / galactosamine-1-phosphate N-acetyltransferase
MNSWTAKDFFSLGSFAHGDLWQEEEFVWKALSSLDAYFQKFPFEAKKIDVPSSVCLDRPEQILIGEGTILEPGVYIQGPCILGPGCIVRHGAYLRSGVICGKNCVIGHASEIKHSIFLNGVHVAHLVYVGDSILGNRVNLGAGVKCANLRLDRCEVKISSEGGKIGTGLKKMGAIIGDGCQIGCNTVINPGTLLGSDCASYPLLNLHGVIPPRTRIKNKNSELDLAPIEAAILNWLR